MIEPIFLELDCNKEVVEIKELDVLPKDDNNIYYALEYTKKEKHFLYIGIRTTEEYINIKVTSDEFVYNRDFEKSITKNNLWFINFNGDLQPLGLNQCGLFKIIAQKLNNEIEECKVEIRTIFDKEDYRKMKLELKNITEKLLSKNIYTSYRFFDLNKIQLLVNELEILIQHIEAEPAEELRFEIQKTYMHKINKINERTLIEYKLEPYSKITGLVTTKSIDIIEHRIIKGAIVNLYDVCLRQYKEEKKKILQKNNDVLDKYNSIKKYIHNKDIRNNIENLDIETIQKYISQEFKAIGNWLPIINTLENLIDTEFLVQFDSEEFKETHLFNFHPLYSQIFETLEQLRKELNQTVEVLYLQKDLISSPYLYQNWIFFKILDYLIFNLKFNVKHEEQIIKKAIDYYNKENSLIGFSIKLQSKSNNINIEVHNEKTFEKNETLSGEVLRPDIALKINNSWIFLDAKYKPYSKMKTIYKNDIENSATRYRENILNSRTAFLVHPDKSKKNDFNYNKPHKDGSFPLTPTYINGLIIFFKIVLHYHLNYDICTICGNENIKKQNPLPYKTYYICNECNEFWVKNKCWNRSEHLYSNDLILYKYLNNNIHIEDNELVENKNWDWDVPCPVCNKLFKDKE